MAISMQEFAGGSPVQLVGNETAREFQEQSPVVQDEIGRASEGAMKALGSQLVQRYKEGVGGALDQIKRGQIMTPQGKARFITRPVGAAGRAVGDVVGAGISAIIPDDWEKKIGETLAPVVTPVIERFKQLEATNPDMARDIEDAIGVTNLLGFGAAKSAAVTPVKAGARAAASAAEKVIPDTSGISPALIANVNRLNPTDRVKFQTQQGVSMENWLQERGIIGTREQTVKQLADNFQVMREHVDEALDQIPGNFRDKRITVVADEAAQYAKSIEDQVAGRLGQLAEKAQGEGLTVPEINEIKRYYERHLKMGYMQDATKTSADVARTTNRDSGIREMLYDIADKGGFTNLREVSKEIQGSKFLMDKIAGKMEGQAANNPMGLTDWIVFTGSSADPSFLASFFAKKLVFSERGRAYMARLFNHVKPKELPRADLDEIGKRAQELLQRQEDIRVETQKAAILADELQKAGFTMSEGTKGFITENPIPLTRQEQALIRAAKNHDEQRQIVQYILDQRDKGNAVGEGFVVQDINNTPILNPKERFSNE